MAHGAFENELDALAGLRELLSFLPSSNRADLPRVRLLLLHPMRCALPADRTIPVVSR